MCQLYYGFALAVCILFGAYGKGNARKRFLNIHYRLKLIYGQVVDIKL